MAPLPQPNTFMARLFRLSTFGIWEMGVGASTPPPPPEVEAVLYGVLGGPLRVFGGWKQG